MRLNGTRLVLGPDVGCGIGLRGSPRGGPVHVWHCCHHFFGSVAADSSRRGRRARGIPWVSTTGNCRCVAHRAVAVTESRYAVPAPAAGTSEKHAPNWHGRVRGRWARPASRTIRLDSVSGPAQASADQCSVLRELAATVGLWTRTQVPAMRWLRAREPGRRRGYAGECNDHGRLEKIVQCAAGIHQPLMSTAPDG